MTKTVEIINKPGWTYYVTDDHGIISNCGKWMYFFQPDEYENVVNVCKSAVSNGIVKECKHTCKEDLDYVGSGVICFYIDGSDNDAHRRVLKFMRDNNLILKTVNDKYIDISFKFDNQTLNGEYGSHFKAKIKRSDFMDDTGNFWSFGGK